MPHCQYCDKRFTGQCWRHSQINSVKGALSASKNVKENVLQIQLVFFITEWMRCCWRWIKKSAKLSSSNSDTSRCCFQFINTKCCLLCFSFSLILSLGLVTVYFNRTGLDYWKTLKKRRTSHKNSGSARLRFYRVLNSGRWQINFISCMCMVNINTLSYISSVKF